MARLAALKRVPLTAEESRDWDGFCDQSGGAWFWHTTHWLQYTLNYRPDLKSRSLSFAVSDGRRVLGIAPLAVEEHHLDGGVSRQLSFGGDACWSPALDSNLEPIERSKILRFVLEEVDNLAYEHGVDRASFRVSPLVPSFKDHSLDFVATSMRFGYFDASLSTCVLDLGVSSEALWDGLRDGHRWSIRKGSHSLEVLVVDRDNPRRDIFEQYRLTHHKAAGRITRPIITFEMMYDWIGRGFGVLFCARSGRDLVGFVYILAYKDAAYYASSANDPDHGRLPIGHLLHWEAIRWLQGRGFRRYEIGLNQFGTLPHESYNEKALGISRFKRGFGGSSFPLFVREKYYESEAYLSINRHRTEDYCQSIVRLRDRRT